MTNQGGALEIQSIKRFAQVIDERIDRVLLGALRLVREPVSLEIDGDDAKSSSREGRHGEPEYVRTAAPPVHQQDRR